MTALPFLIAGLLFCACAAALFYFLYPRAWFFAAFLGCCVVFLWGLNAGEPFIAVIAVVWLAICWRLDRPRVRTRVMRLLRAGSSAGSAAAPSERGLDRDALLKLRVKEFIRDMREGVSPADLSERHGFGPGDAEGLLEKLNSIGLGCPECEKAWRNPSPRCPYCGTRTGLVVEPE